MKKIRVFYLLRIAVCLLCFLAAIHGFALTANYRLQPSDVMTITVHGHRDLKTKTRVTKEGYITFPLLEKVYVKDMTVLELEDKLKTLLEKDFLVDAQVVVFINAYNRRQISVIGEVKKPGQYKMPEERDMTLIMALAMARGYTKDAYLKEVRIIRMKNGVRQILTVNVEELISRKSTANEVLKNDIVLEPDDIVIVTESFF